MDKTTTMGNVTRRQCNKPALEPILTRLRFPLAPLCPMPEGFPHPFFPKTLLAYHLLTEEQLDSLAYFYHQIPNHASSSIWMYSYPVCMSWDADFLAYLKAARGVDASTKVKRRKFGKFIGLRGCETPVEEVEEYSLWQVKKARMSSKTQDMAFGGRRGWRKW